MAISEESRHHLYRRLEEVLGPEEAATLMEHLPPVGWADVATKRDLDTLRRDIEASVVATRQDIESLALATKYGFDDVRREIREVTLATREQAASSRAEFEHELRVLSVRFVTVVITAFSLLLAAISVATAIVKL
jgi:hypothetical protein